MTDPRYVNSISCPIGDPNEVKKYRQGRKCKRCRKLLSVYQPNKYCCQCQRTEAVIGKAGQPKPKKPSHLRGISKNGCGGWVVNFKLDKKSYYLGTYKTQKQAVEVKRMFLDGL